MVGWIGEVVWLESDCEEVVRWVSEVVREESVVVW